MESSRNSRCFPMLLSSGWLRLSMVILYFFLGKSKTNVIIKPHLTVKYYGSSYKECPPGTSGLGLINDKWQIWNPGRRLKSCALRHHVLIQGRKLASFLKCHRTSLPLLPWEPYLFCPRSSAWLPGYAPQIKIRLSGLWPKEQEHDCSHKEPHTPRPTSPCKKMKKHSK